MRAGLRAPRYGDRRRRVFVSMLLTLAVVAAPVGVADALDDTTPPFLIDFSIVPGSVDTTSGAQAITFIAQMADDLSGVALSGNQSQARFVSPSGGQFLDALFFEAPVSGDALIGTWEFVAEIPQFAEAGIWSLDYFYLADEVGNYAYLTAPEVAAIGGQTSFEVTGPSDSTPPTLVGLSISPTEVDVTDGPASITITADMSDDLVGVGENSQVQFVSPSGTQYAWAVFQGTPIAGDQMSGTWVGDAQVRQYAESGTWTISVFYLTDLLGNQVFLEAADVAALGFPTSFEVTGTSDTTAPSLVDFSLDPVLVDVSEGPSSITFTAVMTDDLSGLGCGLGECSASQARFISPSAGQFVDAVFFEAPVSGGALDGTWEFIAEIPQFAEAGTWHLLYFLLTDQVGNQIFLGESDLLGMGLPTLFEVFGSNLDEVTVLAIDSPNSGDVTVEPVPPTPGESFVDGYLLLGARLSIEAPLATPEDPLVITFAVDPNAVPAGVAIDDIVVFRNGVAIEDCGGIPNFADPDPCVSARDASGAPWTITVLTSAASVWAMGIADSDGDGVADAIDADGAISGTVTDPSGPVEGVTVNAISSIHGSATAVTDSDGNYEISPLNPGSYVIEFTSYSYAAEYYDDTADFSSATQVSVLAGKITAHIDAVLGVDGATTTATGFYAPVDMGGIWNVVRAGSTVPLKFEIFMGDEESTDLADVLSLAVTAVWCSPGDSDPLEYVATAGTALRYDTASGQFIQNWKTPRLTGTCWRVTMTTHDGVTLEALFRLT